MKDLLTISQYAASIVDQDKKIFISCGSLRLVYIVTDRPWQSSMHISYFPGKKRYVVDTYLLVNSFVLADRMILLIVLHIL